MSGRKHSAPIVSDEELDTQTYSSPSKKLKTSPIDQPLPPLNLLNPTYTSPEFVKSFYHAFHRRILFHDSKTGASIYTHPFCSAVLPSLFSSGFLQNVKSEISTEQYTHRSNDLHEFYQSGDLTKARATEKPYLSQLRDTIYSNEFVEIMSELTGIELDETTVDLSAHIYVRGNYLLCHDDDIRDEEYSKGNSEEENEKREVRHNRRHSGRRVAFIIYLVDEDWEEKDGGTLDLFDIDNQGHPQGITKKIIPQWNTMVFFEVSPTSYHQVSEVLSETKSRLSISGWFHGSLKNRLSKVEYFTVDDVPSPKLLDLAEFISPDYLAEEAIEKLLGMIHSRGSAELRGFLREDVYARLLESFREAVWENEPVGPAFVRRYHCLKSDDNQNMNNNVTVEGENINGNSDKLHQKKNGKEKEQVTSPFYIQVRDFFTSTTFRDYLERITRLAFHSCSRDIRQFQRGDYTIAHDQAGERAGVDVMFSCIDGKWNEEWEGAMVYYAEDREDPVHILWPSRNTLYITERIDGISRFVKYVNCFAEEPRREMVFTWLCDGGGIEEEGEEELTDDDKNEDETKYAAILLSRGKHNDELSSN